MKTTYNKICFGICLLGGALAGSCTGDYMDYNRNWAEVSPEETERDEYLVSSLLGGMQSNVIPVEEHLNQFTECLMGGVWGRLFRRLAGVGQLVLLFQSFAGLAG